MDSKAVGNGGLKRSLNDEPRSTTPTPKFVWVKKQKKDIERGLTPEELAKEDAARRERNRLQIEKLERQRLEREAEREERQRVKETIQFEREKELLGNWEEKERVFHRQQALAKAHLRISQGRAKPFDLLLINTTTEKDFSLATEEKTGNSAYFGGDPAELIETMNRSELEELVRDFEGHLELELDKTNLAYINALLVYLQALLEFNDNVNSNGIGVVKQDVETLLKGKSAAELVSLEASVRTKLAGNGPMDIDYWEGLLGSILEWRRRALLRETHQAVLDRLLTSNATLEAASMAQSPASQSRDEHYRHLSSSYHRSDSTVAGEPELSSKPLEPSAHINWDPHADSFAMFKGEMNRKVNRDEIPFNAEADDLSAVPPAWLTKKGHTSNSAIKSVKPRFFNRVRMNYEWNKYNQTHYDAENPPPKVVQGYRFNIFYPGLTDPTTMAPTYRVEKDPASPDSGMKIVRFMAGPPYEDLVFRISGEEWDLSHRNGFKCTFEGRALRLHFWFKNQRYRR